MNGFLQDAREWWGGLSDRAQKRVKIGATLGLLFIVAVTLGQCSGGA